jgi:hypothetical protein
MAYREENKSLYKRFGEFIDKCLIQDKSLLWPDESYWTANNLDSIKKRTVDTPIEGSDLTFEEKLKKQLSGATKAEWAIICDIYYVYFMPSTHISFDKKLKDIQLAAKEGKLKTPSTNAKIWEALNHGFTRTGIKYHQKYSQFWLIVLFAIFVKEHDTPKSLVKKHHVMRQTLDMILDKIPNKMDRAYDIRHAMLYMAFPEFYERMISTGDKQRVVTVYGNKIKSEMPVDLDDKILKIRGILSTEYDKSNRTFDFYQDLKKEWRPAVPTVPGRGTGLTVPTGNDEQIPAKEVTAHTEIQWILLKLGSDMGLDVWVARNDRNKEIKNQKFSELPRLLRDLPVKFDEITNKTIELIDVLWIKGNAIMAAFEIESTTSIYSGILRMADLIAMQPNINVPLYIVAPDKRKTKVFEEVNRPVFSLLNPPMKEMCKFISFSALRRNYSEAASFIKHLKPEFLEDFSETCDLDE